MIGAPVIRAEGFPPKVEDLHYADWIPGLPSGMLTTVTVSVFLAVGVIICFFLLSYRNPQIVPTRKQWVAESVYGFVRDGIARDLIGPEGIRFAAYFTTLFSFIAVTNLMGIIPFIQNSPNSHIAFPAMLGVITWLLYNFVGVKKHGFFGYIKASCIPNGTPWYMYPLIIPLEFLQNFILRPVTLAVRLFANMFAGHMILVVFILGGVALIEAGGWFVAASPLAFLMAIVMSFFEFFVMLLQAYVFTLLTAVYVQGSLADEH
ncbi:ATP synthase F0 subcomplex A subunit [Stackebrandtia endophytica]|uniref:ATP synthase subunit a n=1 Tax=Stackebrandtia endophytica TaxID=1496996 RepID=A0A543B0F8_9ACTN|nr:ATP synthase F0 subcomplex A subunit [Stackebrandtia endophytica]